MDIRLDSATGWFEKRGWTAFPFQQSVWTAYLEGKSGLVHSSTGTGKTYAVWLGPLLEALRESSPVGKGIRVLWITPLRALVEDTLSSIQLPVTELGLPWTVEARTGDTSFGGSDAAARAVAHGSRHHSRKFESVFQPTGS